MTKKARTDTIACRSGNSAAKKRFSVSFSGDAKHVWAMMRETFPNLSDSQLLLKLSEGASDPWDRALHEFRFLSQILSDVLDEDGEACVEFIRALLLKMRFKKIPVRELREHLQGLMDRLEGHQ